MTVRRARRVIERLAECRLLRFGDESQIRMVRLLELWQEARDLVRALDADACLECGGYGYKYKTRLGVESEAVCVVCGGTGRSEAPETIEDTDLEYYVEKLRKMAQI